MKKRTRTLCIILAMIALFSGCGKKEADRGSVEIYYAAIESGDYYEGWASQLKEQAGVYGAEFEVGYAEKSLETQISQIKGAVGDGYNVFLCGLVSPETATVVKAAAGEIPIVFINNAPDEGQLEKDRYIYVASDEFMAGEYQAEYVLEKFSDKEEINVAVLKGPKGASGAEGRTKGLKQTLKASGKKINYVFEDYADWSNDTARELMGIFLRTGKTVDCVVANNDDMALGGLAAFEDAGVNTDSVLFWEWTPPPPDAKLSLRAEWILPFFSPYRHRYLRRWRRRSIWQKASPSAQWRAFLKMENMFWCPLKK